MSGITITRTFAAPVELVYDAWTDPTHFAVWFGTESVAVDGVSIDARAGGSWAATMHLPDGSEKDWVGDYLEADPPTHLVLTITDQPDSSDRAVITVDLLSTDGGTEMTMTQTGGGMDDETYEMVRAGYLAFFDAMEAELARAS